MARQYDVDDSEWIEVKAINGYALFMGYLMMGVRGLGLLIITWTTVVLLGGFVSDLGKKDFWCLTGITLIQTAGVFNFLLTEKLSDMVHLSWGLLAAAIGTFDKAGEEESSTKRLLLAFAALAIQGVVLFVILCPISILYVFGIYISAGASLWRLIKQDFGNDGDGGANMKPALQVLYSLAVAQGVLFGYKTIHAFAAKTGLVKVVYNRLDKEVHEAQIEEYLEETVAGCEKDPSFVSRRNLVTYGVDLMMEAKSNEGFIAGIKVLGGAINVGTRGKKVLAKYLLARSDDSSSAIIQRLLETVGPRSPYNREIKGYVVRILDIIAPCLRLEQYPRAIECLCSVVDTAESNELKGNDTDEARLYGSKFMDYERVELLEEYQKDYVKYDLRIDSPKGTLREKLYQCLRSKWLLIQHCLLGKGKEVQNKSKRKENITTNFDWLLIEAVDIIHKLVADEDNLWILRTSVPSTVLHKIARLPLKLHRESHGRLREFENDLESQLQMVEKCRELTEWLLVALVETSSPPLLPAATPVGEGRKITRRRRSSSSKEIEQLLVLRTMDGSALRSTIRNTIDQSTESAVKCILDCLDCGVTAKRKAIEFLLHLSLDMSTIVEDSESSRRLLWILLLIYGGVPVVDMKRLIDVFMTWDLDDGIKRLAEEKLSEMLREKYGDLPFEESEIELQLIDLALEDLNRGFHDVDISIRTHAVIIMEGLFRCYDDRFRKQVEKFSADAIPEVVKETLTLCGPKTAERQEVATDVEKGSSVSQDNQDACIDTQPLRKALVSLCRYYNNVYSTSINFKKIASEICKEQGKTVDDFMQLVYQSIE